MPKTYGNLKAAILSFSTRADSVFNINSWDNLKQAVNNAKDYAQRAIIFKYAEAFAQVPNVSLTAGGSIANAVLFGTATAVIVRAVKQVYLGVLDGSGQVPIDMMSRDQWAAGRRRQFEGLGTLNRSEVDGFAATDGTPFVYVPVGQTFYIFPPSATALGPSPITVYMDIVQWIPDFASDADTHWLLDYCFDYMLYRSIWELNCFLKEDQRIPISDTVLKDCYDNIKNWNETVQGFFLDDAKLN